MNRGNRGKPLEDMIERTNEMYRQQGIAEINKIATPVRVLRQLKGRIRDGFYEKKSTVDFIGAYEGIPIAFDAKSTQEPTRFALKYIEPHQLDFLKRWQQSGGYSFFLIEFATRRQEVFLVPLADILAYFEIAESGGRKSIPYDEIKRFPEVKRNGTLLLDYLSVVDRTC